MFCFVLRDYFKKIFWFPPFAGPEEYLLKRVIIMFILLGIIIFITLNWKLFVYLRCSWLCIFNKTLVS